MFRWPFSLRRRRLRNIASSRDPAQAAAIYIAAFGDIRGSVPGDMRYVLQRLLPIGSFPILPDDDLWDLYDLDQGALESEIEEYFLSNGRRWMPPTGGTPPRTVTDLVRTVARHYADAPTT